MINYSSLGSMPKYRIVIIGPAGSGKTSLIKRFMEDNFSNRYIPTIDDVYTSVVQRIDGSCLQVELIDTCGSQCFPAMIELRIRSADVLVIVMSLAEEIIDCNHIQNMFRSAFQFKKKSKRRVLLVANKSDLMEETAECERMAEKMSNFLTPLNDDMPLEIFVTSSKSGENILNLFNSLLEVVFQVQYSPLSPIEGHFDFDSLDNKSKETGYENNEESKFLSSIKKRRQSLGIDTKTREEKGTPKGIHKKWSLLPDVELRQRKERSMSIDTRFPMKRQHLLATPDNTYNSKSAQDHSLPSSQVNLLSLSSPCKSEFPTPGRNKKKSYANNMIIDERASLKITQEIGKKLSLKNENNFISVSKINISPDMSSTQRVRSNSLFLKDVKRKSLTSTTSHTQASKNQENCLIS